MEELVPVVGSEYSNFKCVGVGEYIPHLDMQPFEFVHTRTGQRYVKLQSKNRVEATFVMSFYTPPDNHCGLPHICEHTVLSGSEKFPLKDAFNEMYKSSLKTFLNAFTYSDYTVYPLRTYCEQDFFNLLTVDLDSILRPILYKNPLVFYQEGFHYEIKDGKLTEQGIVLNEMKGVFDDSSYEAMEVGEGLLFKDTPLKYVSGGDPKHIIKLKPEDLEKFHAAHYNNKNSVILINSMFSWEKELMFLNANIDGNDKTKDKAKIPYVFQEDYSCGKEIAMPINKDGKPTEGEKEADTTDTNNGKFYRFILGPKYDEREELFGLEIADYILHDSPSSPVKIAAESCLCSSFSSSCDNSAGRSSITLTFSQTPTQDIESKWAEEFAKDNKIERLEDVKGSATHERFDSFIREIYEEVCEPGKYAESGRQWYEKIKSFKLTDSLIESVIDRIELTLTNRSEGRIMYSIISAAKVYHYDNSDAPKYKDVTAILDYETSIKSLRRRLKEGTAVDFIKGIVKKYFLGGTKNDIIQMPVLGYRQVKETRDNERVDGVYQKMSEEEKEGIKSLMKELLEFQTEDESEKVKLLPVLTVDDIRKDLGIPEMLRGLDYEEVDGQVSMFKTKSPVFPTSGISFVDVSVDMTDLASPTNNMFLISMAEFLGNLPTEHHSIFELTELKDRVGSLTVSLRSTLSSHYSARVFLKIGGACLKSKRDSFVELIREVLFHTHQRLTDPKNQESCIEKLGSLLTKLKIDLSRLVYKNILSRSSEMRGYLTECFGGIESIRALARIQELSSQIKDDNEEYSPIAEKLGKQGSIPFSSFLERAIGFYSDSIYDKTRFSIVTSDDDPETIASILFEGEKMKVANIIGGNRWKRDVALGQSTSKEEKDLIKEVASYYFNRSIALPIDCCYVGTGGSINPNKEEILGTQDTALIEQAAKCKKELASGRARILKHYYSNGYLWDKIRNEAGAYGVFVVTYAENNDISVVSYRDPNLAGTVAVYRALPLANNEAELNKAKNGAVAAIQPGCTYKALFEEITNLIIRKEKPEDLVRRFNEILDATHKECEEAGKMFMEVLHSSPVTVAASEAKIKEAMAQGHVAKWEKIVE